MGADLERERALKEKLDAFQKQNVALMRLLACNGQVRRGDVVKEYEISQFSYTTLIDALSTEQVAQAQRIVPKSSPVDSEAGLGDRAPGPVRCCSGVR